MAKQQNDAKHDGKKDAGAKQPKKRGLGNWSLAALVVVLAAVVVFLLYYPNLIGVSSTPFSTFKANLNAAPKISLVVTYGNNTQYSSEAPCFPQILEILGHGRSPSTIGLYILNKTTCTYSKTGLGGGVQPVTANASYCLNEAKATPSIYLNYSNTNSTLIRPYDMYIYGNGEYMAKCSVATDFA